VSHPKLVATVAPVSFFAIAVANYCAPARRRDENDAPKGASAAGRVYVITRTGSRCPVANTATCGQPRARRSRTDMSEPTTSGDMSVRRRGRDRYWQRLARAVHSFAIWRVKRISSWLQRCRRSSRLVLRMTAAFAW